MIIILTLHILAGAAIGSKISSPEAVAGLSILAHFVMDAIPHYDYKIDAITNAGNKSRKKYLISLFKIWTDLLTGAFIVMFFVWESPQKYLVILGTAIAVIPDFVLFLHYQNPNLPIIRRIAAFHNKIHWFEKIAKPDFLGLATQAAVTILALIILAA